MTPQFFIKCAFGVKDYQLVFSTSSARTLRRYGEDEVPVRQLEALGGHLDVSQHHCRVFQIVGPSYRMKGKEGLFQEG